MASQQQLSGPHAGSPSEPLKPAPYTNHTVAAGGLKLNFLDYGRAGRVPMLCVHGGGAHAHWFDFVAAGFVADHHVRAIDLRGHGDSEWGRSDQYSYARYAADLAEVVEKLDLRDFVLVGHSMGGMCALLYATTYPGRVRRLVIVDTSFNLTANGIANMRNVGSREGSSYASLEEFSARFRLRPGETYAAPEVLRHIARLSARPSADGLWRGKFDRQIFATRVQHNGLPLWDKVAIPALAVKGDRSARITAEVFADVKSRCPQAALVEVADSDHHVTLDNPGGFVHAVGAWLRQQA